jgi:hypothetical protein|tara:strand:- start:70866 stop:72056 length:1191 start_codon:yes stop_codon:yes gene_type:complete
LDKPEYPHKAIGSVDALAQSLGTNPSALKNLVSKVDNSYTPILISTNNGTKERQVYEPKYYLKKIQKRINREIFEKVKFPTYLQGSIRDVKNTRDFVKNAGVHSGANDLISLDITGFYDHIKEEYVSDIFTKLFSFPPDVSEILTKLVTYKGIVPQGACTSSYVANLVFFNSEYRVYSRLKNRHNVKYTRLLDDVTLSSERRLTDKELTICIDEVKSLFRKYDLKSNDSKKKVQTRKFHGHLDFQVTGLWVGHKTPRLRKKERRYIRQLVYSCEREYERDSTKTEYHELWNRTSGKVAKMARLNHSQSRALRERLKKVLPTYNQDQAETLIYNIKRFVDKVKKNKIKSDPAKTKNFNTLVYQVNILTRTNKSLANSLRLQLMSIRKSVNLKSALWD